MNSLISIKLAMAVSDQTIRMTERAIRAWFPMSAASATLFHERRPCQRAHLYYLFGWSQAAILGPRRIHARRAPQATNGFAQLHLQACRYGSSKPWGLEPSSLLCLAWVVSCTQVSTAARSLPFFRSSKRLKAEKVELPGLPLPLPKRLVKQHRRSCRRVQRLNLRSHRYVNSRIRRVDHLFRQSCSFISHQQ